MQVPGGGQKLAEFEEQNEKPRGRGPGHAGPLPGRPGRSLDGVLGTKGDQRQFLSRACLVQGRFAGRLG